MREKYFVLSILYIVTPWLWVVLLCLPIHAFSSSLNANKVRIASSHLKSDSVAIFLSSGNRMKVRILAHHFVHQMNYRVIEINFSEDPEKIEEKWWEVISYSPREDIASVNRNLVDYFSTYKPGKIIISKVLRKNVTQMAQNNRYFAQALLLGNTYQINSLANGKVFYRCQKTVLTFLNKEVLPPDPADWTIYISPFKLFLSDFDLKSSSLINEKIIKKKDVFKKISRHFYNIDPFHGKNYLSYLCSLHLALEAISLKKPDPSFRNNLTDWKQFREESLGVLIGAYTTISLYLANKEIKIDYKSPVQVKFVIGNFGDYSIQELKVIPELPFLWSYQAVDEIGILSKLSDSPDQTVSFAINVEPIKEGFSLEKNIVIPFRFYMRISKPEGGTIPFLLSSLVKVHFQPHN